ncbi:(deoxy)nucleoside triphosphate pyrophosphohydrolase [Pedobacter sp. CFBP9032]|uniref:(deoxy)nucleoside triphosphate pyrophosphohydrolase n=1 Tax=Pedobacter sp. CFBP9032 TaxID=3096539 RepID=UPI002A6B1F2A|nr:(deoxy)nucleoside triphosphate pyrophosphohydrolase [Pedobacter sp. CFBP9032]MDY0905117.1 (deoxy)nucleoside triphosphate pyrophosphohydrolase [Pedobacter sp. CFBP9032]
MSSDKAIIKKIFQVSCAIIVSQNKKILVTQRSSSMSLPLKWEFPGGKIEREESPEQTVVREIKEELHIEISISNKLPSMTHNYENFSIILNPFICKIEQGEIKLSEHQAFRWLNPNKLLDLDWAEADIPVAQYYLQTLNK